MDRLARKSIKKLTFSIEIKGWKLIFANLLCCKSFVLVLTFICIAIIFCNHVFLDIIISTLSSSASSFVVLDFDWVHSFYVLKVKAGSAYHSCCVIVKNMQRCVYAIPKDSVFDSKTIAEFETDTPDSRNSEAALRTTLQVSLHICMAL